MLDIGMKGESFGYEEFDDIIRELVEPIDGAKAGDRVAQIELQEYSRVLDWNFESNERTGGFGSTGEN